MSLPASAISVLVPRKAKIYTMKARRTSPVEANFLETIRLVSDILGGLREGSAFSCPAGQENRQRLNHAAVCEVSAEKKDSRSVLNPRNTLAREVSQCHTACNGALNCSDDTAYCELLLCERSAAGCR